MAEAVESGDLFILNPNIEISALRAKKSSHISVKEKAIRVLGPHTEI